MAFKKQSKPCKKQRVTVKRTKVDARPLIQIDLPDKQWKRKLAKCDGAIVKLTVEKTTADMLETARAALKTAAAYAKEKGAVHVVTHPPRVLRVAAEEVERESAAGLPLRDAVVAYMRQHPCCDEVREVAERILTEAT